MNNKIKFILSLFFYAITGIGISLTILGNIGVSSFNSMNLAISNVLNIKIGSVTTFINLIFLLGYMILTKFKNPLKYLLQLISVISLGFIINVFYYYFFSNILLNNYFSKFFIFILGTIIAGISTGMVINLNIITFPIESFCLIVSEKTKYSFMSLRYFVDVFSVVVSLLISISFNLEIFIREGTLISLMLLSATIGLTKNIYSKYFVKNKLIIAK